MGMPAASIADISDGESRSAKFKLCLVFSSAEKNMNIFQLTQFRVVRYGVRSELPVF